MSNIGSPRALPPGAEVTAQGTCLSVGWGLSSGCALESLSSPGVLESASAGLG